MIFWYHFIQIYQKRKYNAKSYFVYHLSSFRCYYRRYDCRSTFVSPCCGATRCHIVQSSDNTTSYGKDTGNGNTYYEFPSWMPKIDVTKIVLPVSVFSIKIENYEAYDLGRLPL